ncbi:uncharacterized protein BJX67DRAFT_350728 [Aspergillus lucknowensis]|uniref:Pre-mRNA-splicing factor 38B n=1 Tax=Aspergillus lucknowensis TaxID=176173 RepID=A0ABR4LV47_9EURO
MPPSRGKAIGDPNDDDYVAQVLANEARDSSLKYSSLGMGAYMPRRPTGSAPKPNTRFLRHIIKETDNHNMALKRKEEKEARGRMRLLRAQAPSSPHNRSRDRYYRRSPEAGDRDSRRGREEGHEDWHSHHRKTRRNHSRSPDREPPRSSRRRHGSPDGDDEHRRSRRSHRRPYHSESRSLSPHERSSKYRSRYRRHGRRSSPRSRSPGSKEIRKRRPSPRRQHSASPAIDTRDEASLDDSDPLEDLVGPLPKEEAPTLSRGRGAYGPNSSNIDAHFAPDYDPTLDVQPDEDDVHPNNRSTRRPVAGLMTGDDDWELALEALRDRARWKQKGEERLRKAGFTNDVVERWKSGAATTTGADEERLESVKWSTKGEGREWDRGKFIDEDGHVDVKASW